MIFLEINNPRPIPLSDLVANFSKMTGRMSGSIPEPESFCNFDNSVILFAISCSI